MSKYFITICFIFFHIISFCQVWEGYKGNFAFYSVDGSMELTHVKRLYYVQNGNENRQFLRLDLQDMSNENIQDTTCNFWGGPLCIWKRDSPTILGSSIVSGNYSVRYFNNYGDSLYVDLKSSIGNNQTVYNVNNYKVNYFCFSKDTLTLFGYPDSVIRFTITTTDTLGNVVPSILNGDTVIYSKNTGLYKGFAFDYFPNNIKKIQLYGIRTPNVGFSGLTEAMVHDYQPGDKFEISNYSPNTYYIYFYTVLSRTDFQNNVDYSLQLIKGTGYPPYPPVIFQYDTFTISESYSKTNYVDFGFNNFTYDISNSYLNNCWQGVSLHISDGPNCEVYCPSSDCYGSTDCFGVGIYNAKYAQKLGPYLETLSYNGMGLSYANTISYFNIQGLECGSSIILSVDDKENTDDILIYPNPTQNFISIRANREIKNGIVVFKDILGKIVLKTDFINDNRIDLGNFERGVYFLEILSDDLILKSSKLIIEK